ncbi:hypothetical protein HV438_18805 [Bacillus sporothermodurans]|nr:hypothetical protein [Heyndrickxia sporothermodurans]
MFLKIYFRNSVGFCIFKKSNYEIDSNKNNHFTFYFGEKIFDYNGEKYGLLSNPFIQVNGEYYIDMKWLQQLFHVKVDENEKQISIR